MKNFLNFIFVVVFNLIGAQNYEIIYDVKTISDTVKNYQSTNEMSLYITAEQKLFINSNILNENSEYIYEPLTTLRNNNKTTIYYPIDGTLYSVTTPAQRFEWTITHETKYIDDIKCQAAITSYNGRTWTAWFSNQFTILSGPYIFENLPGLIIELYDQKKHYHFTMKSMDQKNYDYNIPKSLNISQKKLNEQYLKYYENPYQRFKNMGVTNWVLKDGVTNSLEKQTKNFQENIRNNNNPIDLSNIIDYNKR